MVLISSKIRSRKLSKASNASVCVGAMTPGFALSKGGGSGGFVHARSVTRVEGSFVLAGSDLLRGVNAAANAAVWGAAATLATRTVQANCRTHRPIK